MKIAIHHRKGSFSEHWISYCKKKDLNYKIVNAYDYNIIKQIEDCEIFMWHFHHHNYKDMLFAKQLLFSLEQSGKIVFPDFYTAWHFDDKVGQKYLLESIGAPMVNTFVFYDKESALKWAKQTKYPKVFKLRSGASGSNVKLVDSYYENKKIITKSFKSGFAKFDKSISYQDSKFKFLQNHDLISFIKNILCLLIIPEYSKIMPKEKGYVYFQDFIPNNLTDFRIKVVSGRCWGFQRKVRKNDFRASGSKDLIFDNALIPKKLIRLAFEIYYKLSLQSVAFDFIISDDQPLIVEMSYGFGFDERETKNGFWTADMNFHSEEFNPFSWMIDNSINKYELSLL